MVNSIGKWYKEIIYLIKMQERRLSNKIIAGTIKGSLAKLRFI